MEVIIRKQTTQQTKTRVAKLFRIHLAVRPLHGAAGPVRQEVSELQQLYATGAQELEAQREDAIARMLAAQRGRPRGPWTL